METGDVGFTALFVADDSEGAPLEVVPWSRRQSKMVHRGDWQQRGGRGMLILRWDNSYSRLRAKVVTLEIQRSSPSPRVTSPRLACPVSHLHTRAQAGLPFERTSQVATWGGGGGGATTPPGDGFCNGPHNNSF